MKQAVVAVINRDTREFLRDCLTSIEAQDFKGGISLWVVDNGSTDGSPGMALSDFPDVQLIWNTRNIGYSAAVNQVAMRTLEPYIFVLNSDTVLSPDTVAQVVECFEQNPLVGIVGPRILNTDGSLQYSCREFPSIKDAFMHAFVGLFEADNPYTARYRKTTWDHETEEEADWVSGAFIAIRRKAYEAVGGFDEKYFMYVEDVDICYRMWDAGWKVRYIPRGDVVHHIGQSSRVASTRMMLHHHHSMLRFHRKTYRGPFRLLTNAVVSLGIAARFLLVSALNLYYRFRAALGGAKRKITPGRQ